MRGATTPTAASSRFPTTTDSKDSIAPSSGLVALPVAEKYGLIFVTPTPADNQTIDIDAMLSGLGEDIESYGIGAMAHQETRVVRRRMNWKLMSDTFWEAYHIKVLHAQNVAPLFVKNLAMFDAFGRNTRYIGVRKSIEKLRDLPQEKWDLIPHTTILMNLFPNTILVMQSDHAEIYRIFPAGTHVGESVATISILAPEPSPKWSRTMDLLLGVVDQDFTLGEGIQHNFESGATAKGNVRPLRKRPRAFPPLNPRGDRGGLTSFDSEHRDFEFRAVSSRGLRAQAPYDSAARI